MASITIKYTAPEVPVEADVKQICAMFWPNSSYVDTAGYEGSYEGTVWDTNVEGFGTWEGLASYLGRISHNPNVLIMFKAAVRDGEVTFEEEDPKMVEYYKELVAALAAYGFEIPGDEADADEEPVG